MDAIIFDVDDTLYDQLHPFRKAFEACFPHLHHVPLQPLFVSSRKHSDTLFHENEKGTVSLTELHTYRMRTACKDFGIEISDMEALKFQEYYQMEQQRIELDSEMEKLLDHLSHQKKVLGILTNGPAEHQQRKIDQLGLNRWIPQEHTFISGAIGAAKPHPRVFDFIEETLQLKKENTLYIGDSFANDVIGAKQAGWNMIWLNHRGHDHTHPYVAPDYVVQSTTELLEMLVEKWS